MFSMNSFSNKKFNRMDGLYILLIALLTAIASEIKVIPFNGEAFRFGLGSILFLLLLLIRPPASFVRVGFITGLTVVCFRVIGDLFYNQIDLVVSLKNHLPVLLFYFLFALGLNFIKDEKYKSSPLRLGGVALLRSYFVVDRLLDMGRTVVNVLGNATATIVMSKWEGRFDAKKNKEYMKTAEELA